MTPPSLRPFAVRTADSDLDELCARVHATRWPEPATAPDWQHGIPLDVMHDLCRYLVAEYDWRPAERRLNAHPQYLVELDGLDIHVLHARSPHPDHCR